MSVGGPDEAAPARPAASARSVTGKEAAGRTSGNEAEERTSGNEVYAWGAPDLPGIAPRSVAELLGCLPRRDAVGGLSRIAVQDVGVGGVVLIPEGDPVCVSSLTVLIVNRDPDVLTDPAMLDFDRTDDPHPAFGHGPTSSRAPLRLARGSGRSPPPCGTASPSCSRRTRRPEPLDQGP